MARSNALRNEWTDYARKHGLLDDPPVDAPKRSKYGNVKVTVDGHTFDSKRESQRYHELKLMQETRQIADLELQPKFPLHVMELYRNGPPLQIRTVATYIADFQYVDRKTGEIVVEDVKGMRTDIYRLKKKIAEAVHGIHVREL